jgi:hypothetical protein
LSNLPKATPALAENHLLQSARTPGSPQLYSFSPNTSLAKRPPGKRRHGLQYFALIENFWKLGRGKPAEWPAQVQSGQIPDFGATCSAKDLGGLDDQGLRRFQESLPKIAQENQPVGAND